jgi:glutathione synthase
MPLRVAVQMDPLESIKIAGDSSFALIEAAQKRGHSVFHYDVKTLAYESGRLTAWAAPVTVQRVEGDHYHAEERRRIDLAADIDVVLMRQDPPFDLSYITATHLLERLEGTTLVVNDPASVRNAPEKIMVLDYARFMPPTLIARRIEDIRSFQTKLVSEGWAGDLVMKPLHGNGGKAVVSIPADGSNLAALCELFDAAWVEPHMIQPFLTDIDAGDKRIVLVDGVVAGAINRRPGVGEFRSNLAMGGSAEPTTLTAREEEICAAMGPELKARGLVFVGIDVIGGKWLTEINVTSPTGIMAIDRFNGTDTPGLIWDAIEGRVAARQ